MATPGGPAPGTPSLPACLLLDEAAWPRSGGGDVRAPSSTQERHERGPFCAPPRNPEHGGGRPGPPAAGSGGLSGGTGDQEEHQQNWHGGLRFVKQVRPRGPRRADVLCAGPLALQRHFCLEGTWLPWPTVSPPSVLRKWGGELPLPPFPGTLGPAAEGNSTPEWTLALPRG